MWLENVFDKTYYVAWTPFQDNAVVAISITSMDESMKLVTKATPLNVQVVPEQPMTYREIQDFLEELTDLESSGKNFKFLHGKGVDPRRFNTL